MNKLKKIGVSALAGTLVAFSASAAEWNISGQAGITLGNTDEGTKASAFSQDDTITISASGTTDNGIDVSATFKLEDGQTYDEHNVSFGTEALGTLTFHGHGGSVVMGQYDDITPKAYEEVWDITDGNTSTSIDASTSRINGVGEEDNIFTYVSPSFAGVTFKAAYATTATNTAASSVGNDTAANIDDYSDWGLQYSPEMVEGLTVYYAQGEMQTAASTTSDESTMGFTYAYGPVTIGYQESEEDKSGSASDNELEQYSIAYAINDDLTVSYGEREYDHDTSSSTGNDNLTQKDSGVGISYTMGGVSIGGSFNSSDNVGGQTGAAADVDSYEMNLSFAF